MALSKREQLLLGTTITAIVLGGTYLLAAPLAKSWQAVNTELVSQHRELDLIKSTIDRRPVWQREYDDLRASLKGGTEQFKMTSDVLKKIEEVAGTTGVLLNSRRALQVVDKGVYRELPVQCSAEATVESLVKFLHALQTGSGFMSVEQLQVVPKADNASILRCEIQIRALAGKSEETGS